MATHRIPQPVSSRPQEFMGRIEPLYSHHNDKYPSLSWGFMVYAVRWHLHRMTQAELAREVSRQTGKAIKQEDVSRMERGALKVPQPVRTWLVTVILTRLEDGLELPVPKGLPSVSRNERQKLLMDQHGTFGGKGKQRRKAA